MPDAFPRQPIAPIPPAEVEKICAGEVVERPLSVVKELVENALDAGASEISVELEDGGKRLIRVADNGGGIPYAELALAVRPHHTSKLTCLADLSRIGTLGFRGEALCAIGAVSKLSLSSKYEPVEPQTVGEGLAPSRSHAAGMAGDGPEEDPAANAAGGRVQDPPLRSIPTASFAGRIEVHGGELRGVSRCNLRQGTEAEVRELFYNVPARLKFLRSAQAETGAVAALLTSYALAYPQVRFTLRSGGRELLRSDGDGDLRGVLADVLGSELAADLAPVDFEFPPLAARGYISAPHRHWHNRSRQWFFVNGRPVKNALLSRAVEDALREFLSPGKFPAGVFNVELPPEEVDVNVHPAKTEVSFAQPQAVYSLLLTAVRRALGAAAAQRQRSLTQGMSLALSAQPQVHDPTPSPHPGQRSIPVYEMARPFVPPDNPGRPGAIAGKGITVGEGPVPSRGHAAGMADSQVAQPSLAVQDEVLAGLNPTQPQRAVPPVRVKSDRGRVQRFATWANRPPLREFIPPASIRQVMQVADSYLVLVTDGEVYLIDQHSAHERILFEQLWERLAAGGQTAAARQMLLIPQAIELTPGEEPLAQQLLPALETLGYSAVLDGRSLLLTEVPVLLARGGPELVCAALSELAADGGAASIEAAHKQLCAMLACKAAVKAGQRLAESEREELVAQICSRLSSLSCPHGRPTVVRLGEGELEKLFLR